MRGKKFVIQATGHPGIEPYVLRDNEHILNTSAYAHVESFFVLGCGSCSPR